MNHLKKKNLKKITPVLPFVGLTMEDFLMVRGKTKDSPWPYTLGVCNWCEANFALMILPILPRKAFHK